MLVILIKTTKTNYFKKQKNLVKAKKSCKSKKILWS